MFYDRYFVNDGGALTPLSVVLPEAITPIGCGGLRVAP